MFFVRFDPRIKIRFIKSPALIEANLPQPIAHNLLFKAIAREAAVFGGFIEVEHTLTGGSAGKRIFDVIRDGSREGGEVDEI